MVLRCTVTMDVPRLFEATGVEAAKSTVAGADRKHAGRPPIGKEAAIAESARTTQGTTGHAVRG